MKIKLWLVEKLTLAIGSLTGFYYNCIQDKNYLLMMLPILAIITAGVSIGKLISSIRKFFQR